MRPSWQQYRSLLGTYLWPQRRSVMLLAALIIGTTALQLVGPQVLRRFIDAAQIGAAAPSLLSIAATFLLVAVFTQIVTVAATYWSERVGWHATNTLRAEIWRYIVSGFPCRFTTGTRPVKWWSASTAT